ncbi:TIGR02452 family protein [Paenibacillus sp. YN15]|uniref:TIGR02452 family protein n=1 Tax=Paenibacillus sp. YN15 TaxID=1742774 RepID=UPI000DCF42BD|nr:TIGR02452 family protein [Paenibacillus sp. YN15]RAV02660.1 TIGR02452 family protein [Paenibacillus sp. YN15]
MNINNREVRSQIARETLSIMEDGAYLNREGIRVDVRAQVEAAVRDSKLYTPEMLPEIRLGVDARVGGAVSPKIEVTDESTLAAVQRLVQVEGVPGTVCLNFASAKNPGGGFLGGSQAQEESLARSSALYPCISQMEEMYRYNRNLKTCLYSDHMIYSPRVPVFREDRGGLLETPYAVSMITAPAVNAGVVREREPEHVAMIAPVMLERIRFILSVAAHHGEKAVVLGALGCGVFRNNPSEVAGWFRQVLVDEGYGTRFEHIVFAILDKSAGQRTLQVFERAFG